MKSATRGAWIAIALVTVLTAVFGSFIPKTILDNEVKIYFPSDHASYKKMEALDNTYGSQIFLVVSISNPNGCIVNGKAVSRIRDLTARFASLEGVADVKSMTKIDYLTAAEGGMASGQLVPDGYKGSEAESAALLKRILDWQTIYDRVVISDDRQSSEIIVTVDHKIGAPAMTALYRKIRTIVDGCAGDGFQYRVAGDPVLSQLAQDFMKSDLSRLVPAVSIVVILCLFFSFRTIAGTLLPLITVLFSTIWVVGLMAFMGVHFTVVSSCLPVLLIAVGSAYGIHVLNHYYEDLAHDYGDKPISFDEHRTLIRSTVRKVALPVVLAGITTVIGFASTFTSPIVPLKDFAVFSSIGVTIALVFSLTFIPALLIVRPLPKDGRLSKRVSHRKAGASDASASLGVRTARKLSSYLLDRPIYITVLVGIVVAVSVWGIFRINVESALLSYFPKESTLRRDVEFIDQRFAGSNLMSLVVQGKEKGDLTDPRILSAMDGLSTYLSARHPEIGKIVSYSDFIRRMNKVMHISAPALAEDSPAGASSGSGLGGSFFSDDQPSAASASTAKASASNQNSDDRFPPADQAATFGRAFDLLRDAYAAAGPNPTVNGMLAALERSANYNGAAYDEIPTDAGKYPVADAAELKNLVSQYLVLYSGSLNEYSNDPMQPSAARMSVQLRTHETGVVDRVIADAKDYAARNFPEGYTLTAGGIAEMEVALTAMITSSQVVSLLLSILGVLVVLAIAFRSVSAGLIGAATLGLSILINFGIMGLIGINLDMVTSLISSIAVGIGIDYTIHFLTNYRHERLLSDDLRTVTLNTYLVSGKAILVNALSVALGFLVLSFSEFVVLRYIGILVAICMVTSSLTAMTVLPIVLNVMKPKFVSRPDAN